MLFSKSRNIIMFEPQVRAFSALNMNNILGFFALYGTSQAAVSFFFF